MESKEEEINKDLEKKLEITDKDNEDALEEVNEDKKEEDNEGQVVKTKEEGIENIVEENDLIAKDLTWDEIGIKKEIKEGLFEMGFVKPSKIQSTTYPLIMKEPFNHLIAQAKNGAGKTGAFGLGVISRTDESNDSIQAIIFGHTRELVNQIGEVLSKIAKNTKITVTTLQKGEKPEKVGQVVVTTPGNFDNVFLKRKQFKLDSLKMLVLDEADYMITNDITKNICEKTFNYFKKNNMDIQILFFSATFSKNNFNMIKKYYKKASMIEIKKEELTLKNVKQIYYNAEKNDQKVDFVAEYLKRSSEQDRVIIFVNSKDFCVRLRDKLASRGYKIFILMGGDMDPANRDETIKRFNQGEIQILITTNVLARGYDEKLVKLVINFDIPFKKIGDKEYKCDPETYLHRIGRTGRFGTKGIGLSLAAGERDIKYLKEIEEFYSSKIEEIKSLDDLLKQYKEYLYNNY